MNVVFICRTVVIDFKEYALRKTDGKFDCVSIMPKIVCIYCDFRLFLWHCDINQQTRSIFTFLRFSNLPSTSDHEVNKRFGSDTVQPYKVQFSSLIVTCNNHQIAVLFSFLRPRNIENPL